MQLVSTVTVGAGGASSIEFTSIPQTGTDLLLVLSGRIPDILGLTAYFHSHRFNNDAGASQYSRIALKGTGSAVSSNSNTNDYLQFEGLPTGDSTSNTFSNIQIYIPNYTSSVSKSVSADSVGENNGTATIQQLAAGRWLGTSAITSWKIFPALPTQSYTFAQHSTASLYIITKA